MRKTLLLLTIICSSEAYAQPDIFRYFNSADNESFDYGYLKVDFEWSMDGKLQAFINEGINSLDEEKFGVALSNLNQAVRLDSTLWISHYYRGICHLKTVQLEKAEQDFKTALSFNPSLAEAHVELAKTYASFHQYEKANDQLNEAIRKKPGLADAYFYKGMFELTQGNPYKARRFFEKANEMNPKLAKAHFMQGLIDFGLRGNATRSIEFCNASLQADSTFLPAYFWRAILKSETKPQESLNDLNKLVQMRPESTFYTLMRGFFYIEFLHDYDKAFIDFKKALSSIPVDEDKFVGGQTILDQQIELKAGLSYLIANGYGLDDEAFTLLKKSFCQLLAEEYPEALTSINQAEQKQQSATVYFIKALILERNRYHPNAFEYYDKALALDKDIYDAHRKKCVYYFEVHDWKNAHVELREMFRLQPASPVGHRLRGMVRFAQGYYGPAIGDFTEFIKTDSSDDEVILMRSVSYISVGKLQESLQDRIFLAKRNSKKWEFHEVLVENYLLLKDTIGALETLRVFTVNNPEASYTAYMRIIELYIHQKRWADAHAELIKSDKLLDLSYRMTDQSLILFWKGMVAFHYRNNSQEAIAQFDKSIKLNSGNPEVKYQRARVYESTGQRKRALADYEDLMNQGFKDSKERYNALATKK